MYIWGWAGVFFCHLCFTGAKYSHVHFFQVCMYTYMSLYVYIHNSMAWGRVCIVCVYIYTYRRVYVWVCILIRGGGGVGGFSSDGTHFFRCCFFLQKLTAEIFVVPIPRSYVWFAWSRGCTFVYLFSCVTTPPSCERARLWMENIVALLKTCVLRHHTTLLWGLGCGWKI